jgi:hypothetical protein
MMMSESVVLKNGLLILKLNTISTYLDIRSAEKPTFRFSGYCKRNRGGGRQAPRRGTYRLPPTRYVKLLP